MQILVLESNSHGKIWLLLPLPASSPHSGNNGEGNLKVDKNSTQQSKMVL